MLCERCKKNPATVEITKVINNNKFTEHLCSDCASGIMNFNLSDGNFGWQDFLSNMWPQTEEAKCPECGMMYSDFKKSGKLGCAECYNQFPDQLLPILRQMHGSSEHRARAEDLPKEEENYVAHRATNNNLDKKANNKDEIEAGNFNQNNINQHETEIFKLQEYLKTLINQEKFEEAAKVRDQIKVLEDNKNSFGKLGDKDGQ